MPLMPDIYDEAQRNRGCDRCKELQAENETLKNKIEFLRKRYPEIDAMEQALKGTDELDKSKSD